MEADSYGLHSFCHASMGAYTAVIYFVAKMSSELCVRFVAPKSRVAPCQELTIPSLELLSALLLAWLLESVMKSLSPISLLVSGGSILDSSQWQEMEAVRTEPCGRD